MNSVIYMENSHYNDSIIVNAQNVFGRSYAIVPTSEIDIDDRYQRKQSNRNVQRLIKGWNDDFYDPIKVTYRDGRFKVFDGGHRLLAQIEMGRSQVVCQICSEATVESEAYRFVHQMDYVTRMRPIDTFKANLILGDEVDTILAGLCRDYNVQISSSKTTVKPGELGSISEARNIIKVQGESCLRWIFGVIADSGWHMLQNSYSGFILRVLKNIYTNFEATKDSCRQVLVYHFSTNPALSPKTLKHIAAGARPDLDYRSAAYVYLSNIIKSLDKHIEV